MELEKLLCPQCGGNDLEPFGLKAFKCRFCGAVLKISEPEKKAIPPSAQEPKRSSHYSAPLDTNFRNTTRLNYDRDEETDPGSDFIKSIVYSALAVGIIGLIVYLVLFL